jgi:tetratricopeptide (TPR) repeat protein
MRKGPRLSLLCCILAGVTLSACQPDPAPEALTAKVSPPVETPANPAAPAPRKPDSFGTYEQCVSNPIPAGFHWSRETLEAFCADEFTPPALTYDEFRKMITWRQTDELNERFDSILNQYFAGKLPEGTARYVYEKFGTDDQETQKLVESWLARSPGSAHALAARGIIHLERGATVRGTKLIKDTPPENLLKMHEEITLAKADLLGAIQREPKILYAYEALIYGARLTGDRTLGNQMLAAALRIDPKNFYVRSAYSAFSQPRWGGSEEAMLKVATDARPWLEENPRLVNLRALALAHRGFEDYANESREAALRHYERGLAEGPVGYDLYTAGTIAAKLNRHEYAIELYDQALRFSPYYLDVRRHRARALIALKKYEEAETDLGVALEVEPADAWSLAQYAFLMLEKKDYKGALGKLELAHKTDPADVWVIEKLAAEYLYRTREFKKAEPLIARLLKQAPKSGAAWLMRADLIQNTGGPGLHEAAENFVRYADTSVDVQRAALPKVKAWLASHPNA